MEVRLNKYLADCGIGSRRKVEEFILQGRVEVNNKLIIDLAFKVDQEKDEVRVDGERLIPKRHVYYLLNKPKGVITSTDDEKNRQTVIDLIDTKENIFPAGRLDYNTTGVLILTNDGDFANLVTHPSNRIPREYEVWIDRQLEEKDRGKMLKGVFIEGKRGKFTKIVFPKRNNFSIVTVTAIEGRNHFVKNMFSALGYTVTALNRLSFAGIYADIPVGAYRKMNKTEIDGVIQKYAK